MFENFDSWTAGMEDKIDAITEQTDVTHRRLWSVQDEIKEVHTTVKVVGSAVVFFGCILSLLLCYFGFQISGMKQCPCDPPSCPKNGGDCCPKGDCKCVKNLLGPISLAEHKQFWDDKTAVEKLKKLAPPGVALCVPRIVSTDCTAIASGRNFRVYMPGGLDPLEFSLYTIEKTGPVTNIHWTTDGQESQLSIGPDGLSGYIQLDQITFRVETVSPGFAAIWPEPAKKID